MSALTRPGGLKMALFNEILVGRFNRSLQKLFGIKGGATTPQLSTEIQPSVSFFWGAEMRYLEGWDRFGAYINQPTGGAGQFAQIRFRNPANSNVIAVIEKYLLVDGDASSDSYGVTIAAQTADLTTSVALTANRFDSRGRPNPTLVCSRNTTGVQPAGNQLTVNMAVNGFYEMILDSIHELTLLPGDAITVANNIANLTANVSMWWRERSLEESERT